MKLSEYDRAIVLCVDHRYHKDFPRVQSLMKSKGVEVEAFIDGKGQLLPRPLYNQISPRPSPGWQDKDTAYAHMVAIKSILQAALRDGVETLLFLEDDVELLPEFDEVVEMATAQLAGLPAWDMLYYGSNHTWHRTDILSENVLKLNGSYTTHCCGIKRKMFQPIIDLPAERVLDWMISHYIHPQYSCYGVWPNIAIQQPGYSYLNGCTQDYTDWFKSKGINH
jgi:hypothetical protein